MSGMASASFSSDEQHAIKYGVTNGRPYAHRISFAFATRLFMIKTGLREDHLILDEMDYLEGLRSLSKTKKEEQFRHPPLHPFWHKHYSAPRHVLRNIGIRWGLNGSGNGALDSMLAQLCKTHGDGDWQGVLAHRVVIEGYADRSARGLTGDWIIYAEHHGQLYYLDLAAHEESDDSERLFHKLRAGNVAEFPFLF